MLTNALAPALRVLASGDVSVDRGQNDLRALGQRVELARERDSVSVRQLKVDEDRCGLSADRQPLGPPRPVGLPNHAQPTSDHQSSRRLADLRVGFDHQY